MTIKETFLNIPTLPYCLPWSRGGKIEEEKNEPVTRPFEAYLWISKDEQYGLELPKVNYRLIFRVITAAQFWKTMDKWAMIKQKIQVSHVLERLMTIDSASSLGSAIFYSCHHSVAEQIH